MSTLSSLHAVSGPLICEQTNRDELCNTVSFVELDFLVP